MLSTVMLIVAKHARDLKENLAVVCWQVEEEE